MSISVVEKRFLKAIERQEESTIRNSMSLNEELQRKYSNTYKGYKLLMETMQKNLLKSASILMEERFPIDAINKNTPLHIAVKLECFHLVVTLIRNGAEINIPDENEDYPIHIATNHGFYDLVELLLKKGAKIDVRDGNNETPLMRAIKLHNVKLIKLLLSFDANMNDMLPNSTETCFFYLTVTNPIPNYAPNYKKMDMKIIANIVVNYLMYPNIKIENNHRFDKDIIRFVIEKNLYDLLLRFNLDEMNLPFLKYTAILYNRIDILDKLMTYNSIDNDKGDDKYSLFRVAYDTCNINAFDVLEKFNYFISDITHACDYFLLYKFTACKSFPINLILDKIISHLHENDKENIELVSTHYTYYRLKVCLKRRFIRLDDADLWLSLLQMNPTLSVYAIIFINMKPEFISDMWSMLKCFLTIINDNETFYFNNSELLDLYFSELIRLDYLNQLPNKSEFINILSNEYLNIKYEHAKHYVEKLKSIIIYENQTLFDFYLQNKLCKNIEILKDITLSIEEQYMSSGIPRFISLPLIKRLQRAIKKEILIKNCSLVLSTLFDWPIVIQNKILSYFTRRELKLLCENRKPKSHSSSTIFGH